MCIIANYLVNEEGAKEAYRVSQGLGRVLRQLRRQHSMTQTELGGERFSKSYVSAVEKGKIMPSHEALRHFSSQLGQTVDYFEQFLQQPEPPIFPLSLIPPTPSSNDDYEMQVKALTLLDVLVEDGAFSSLQLVQQLPLLSPHALATLPLETQAPYSFWLGCRARQEGNIAEALHSFEYALGIASLKYRAVILDEIGTCHTLSHAHHSALNAHYRALRLLQEETMNTASTSMRLHIELHCAQDYHALGVHQTAIVHYEHAKELLDVHQNLKTAAQIYYGLGYCTYASLFQASLFQKEQRMAPPSPIPDAEEEKVFQQAINFLTQSSTLYHVGSEHGQESRTRLTQVMILLDCCIRHRRVAEQQPTGVDVAVAARCTTLLEAAEEQCRQILTLEQNERATTASLSDDEAQARLLLLLAYLLSVFVQRAILAHYSEEIGAAKQERAVWFCYKTLTALADSTLTWALLQELMNAPLDAWKQAKASLPPLPALSSSSLRESHAELSLTVGMLAEQLGKTATLSASRDEYYRQADDLFQNALSLWQAARQGQQNDPTLLKRGYQHVISTLEERIVAQTSQGERHVQTLLKLLFASFERASL